MEEEIGSICNAISYQMGEWPTVFETVSGYLGHLLFTVGNGEDFHEGTHSLLVADTPIHQFPGFDREAEQRKNRDRWMRDIQGHYEGKRGRWLKDILDKEIERELAKHVYPDIKPCDLTREAIHKLISESANHPRRKFLLARSKGMDNEYAYVRPYPLSSHHSGIYQLTEKSPKGLIWVAREFSHAWFNYLSAELEAGNFYKGPEISYSGEEWTLKHCKAIGDLAAQFDQWVVSRG